VLHSGRLTRLERFATEKNSSLLKKFVNYGRKKFYNIGPCSSFVTFSSSWFSKLPLSSNSSGTCSSSSGTFSGLSKFSGTFSGSSKFSGTLSGSSYFSGTLFGLTIFGGNFSGIFSGSLYFSGTFSGSSKFSGTFSPFLAFLTISFSPMTFPSER
jgi:hypothetical protein